MLHGMEFHFLEVNICLRGFRLPMILIYRVLTQIGWFESVSSPVHCMYLDTGCHWWICRDSWYGPIWLRLNSGQFFGGGGQLLATSSGRAIKMRDSSLPLGGRSQRHPMDWSTEISISTSWLYFLDKSGPSDFFAFWHLEQHINKSSQTLPEPVANLENHQIILD